jgi:hypothetical protein
MTDVTHITSHELGKPGRPLSPAQRRSRLRVQYIRDIGGVENLTPVLSEAILAATELTVMAAELRKKISKAGGGTSEQMLALVRLENSAARAVSRLPVPTQINTVAAAAA